MQIDPFSILLKVAVRKIRVRLVDGLMQRVSRRLILALLKFTRDCHICTQPLSAEHSLPLAVISVLGLYLYYGVRITAYV